METDINYLEEINKLKTNLTNSSIHYFSEVICDNPEFEKAFENVNRKKLNCVIYIDKNSEILTEIPEFAYFEILNKKSKLEANIFRLLQLKSILNFDQFELIKNKYFDELTTYSNNSSILNNRYDEVCFVKSENLKNCLSIQDIILNEHLNQVKAKFFTIKFNNKISNSFINNFIKEEKYKLKDILVKGNAVEIEKILISEFRNSNNITINRMFTALIKLGYIIEEYGDKKKLIECFNNSIGSEKYESRLVFINKINVWEDEKYKHLRNKINNLIEKL